MPRTTSVCRGEHFESFIDAQIASGPLIDGEDSGAVSDVDMQNLKNEARRRAGSSP